ncbi:MAG: hypothetical protein PHV02_20025 [Rhodocyclaceae bacterium]|nr:hypothetical protein [Rhodocyclaceae bacterium]
MTPHALREDAVTVVFVHVLLQQIGLCKLSVIPGFFHRGAAYRRCRASSPQVA